MDLRNSINTFAIHTLGCKVNYFESNLIKSDLLSFGLIEVDFNLKSDIYIINTCTVTNKADSKSTLFINKAIKLNPDAIIVVMGCFSQINPNLMKKLNISIQIGNKYKNNVIDLINQYIKNKQKIYKVDNLLLENKFERFNNILSNEKTRAFVKIQDGCNYMCSYCIIPFSRGKQRSEKKEFILEEIKKLVAIDYKEIILTGVNIAGYLDENKNNFDDLIESISNIKGDFRVRISSIEPFQISNKLIDLVTSNKNRFCQHWHICLQSGSDKVLKDMNRKYTTKDFLKLILKIKKLSPSTLFTTDYIVGYPTETIEDHKLSIDFLNKIKFFDIHIFPFSKKIGTKANFLKENFLKEKKDKIKDLENIRFSSKYFNLKNILNKELEVIFEKKENANYCEGYSNQYIKVIVYTDKDFYNKKIKVRAVKILGENVICEII